MKITTIRLSESTKQRLNSLRYSPAETYENIILRLLESKVGMDEAKYLLYDTKCKNCWVKFVIDWSVPERNIKYFDRNSDDLLDEVPVYNYKDVEEQERWIGFKDIVEDLDNIYGMAAILESGQSLHLGDLILKRL